MTAALASHLTPAQGENPAMSYHRLRAMIGFVGLALPVTCLLTGIVDGHLQSSISAYYYTKATIAFTGTLSVVGVFLIAYRFGQLIFEGVATTVAGLAALGVAFFHCAPKHANHTQLVLSNVHMACATTLFSLLGLISLLVFPRGVQPPARPWIYRAYGAANLGAIVLIPILNKTAQPWFDRDRIFFWLEVVCVLAFALSFIARGRGWVVDSMFNKVSTMPVALTPSPREDHAGRTGPGRKAGAEQVVRTRDDTPAR